MKKIFSVLTAVLFAGSMMAADVTIEKTMSEIIEENNYSVSAGSDITLYPSFDLNNVVTISTTGEANCGSFWGTAPSNDWRLYQAKNGNITITVDGVTLKKICITYNTSNGGALKTSAGIDIESGLEYDASGESVTYVVKNSGDKTNGQVRVTKIKVVYEDASVKVAAPVIWPERAQFIKMAQVTITCATEGAEIYYTMDGSDPEKGKGGTFEYTGMFQFRKSPTIKAIAYKGEDKSEITTKQFEEVGLLTVNEAIEAMDQSSPILNRFVQGKIVSVDTESFDAANGTMTYWISDDGTATKQIQVYKGYGLEGEHFVTEMALQPGATVTVFGNLKIYQPKEGDPIYEIDQNSVITEYIEPTEGIFNTAVENKAVKTIKNGQLVIIKNGVQFNALGAQIQ
jgi:hypothetical protein